MAMLMLLLLIFDPVEQCGAGNVTELRGTSDCT